MVLSRRNGVCILFLSMLDILRAHVFDILTSALFNYSIHLCLLSGCFYDNCPVLPTLYYVNSLIIQTGTSVPKLPIYISKHT